MREESTKPVDARRERASFDLPSTDADTRTEFLDSLAFEQAETFVREWHQLTKAAFQHYAVAGHEGVNGIFRNPENNDSTDPILRSDHRRAQLMLDAMRDLKSDRPLLLHRGVAVMKSDSVHSRDWKKGEIFADPGFMSCSISEGSAAKFSGKDIPDSPYAPTKSVVMHLKIPEGTPVLCMRAAALIEAEHVEEDELLLPPGCEWEIVDTRVEDGVEHVSLQLRRMRIPAEPPSLVQDGPDGPCEADRTGFGLAPGEWTRLRQRGEDPLTAARSVAENDVMDRPEITPRDNFTIPAQDDTFAEKLSSRKLA